MPQKTYASTGDIPEEVEVVDDGGWLDKIKDVAGGIKKFFAEGSISQAEGMGELGGGYQDAGSELADITQRMQGMFEGVGGTVKDLLPLDPWTRLNNPLKQSSDSTFWNPEFVREETPPSRYIEEMNDLLDLTPEQIVANLQDAGHTTQEISDWMNSPGWRVGVQQNNEVDPADLRTYIDMAFPGSDVDDLTASPTPTYDPVPKNLTGVTGSSVETADIFGGLSPEVKDKIRALEAEGYNREQATYIARNNITDEDMSGRGALLLNRMKDPHNESPEEALEYWKNMDRTAGYGTSATKEIAGGQKETERFNPTGKSTTATTGEATTTAGEVGTSMPGGLNPKQALLEKDEGDEITGEEYKEDLRKRFYTEVYSRPGGSRSDIAGELPTVFGQTKTLFWLHYGTEVGDLLTAAGDKETVASTRQEARNNLESMYGKFLNSYLANPQKYRTGDRLANGIARVGYLLEKWETDKDTTGWKEADERDWGGWVQPFFSVDAADSAAAKVNRRNLIKMSITSGRQGYYSSLIQNSAAKMMNHYSRLGMSEQEIFKRMTRVFGQKPKEPTETEIDAIDPATAGIRGEKTGENWEPEYFPDPILQIDPATAGVMGEKTGEGFKPGYFTGPAMGQGISGQLLGMSPSGGSFKEYMDALERQGFPGAQRTAEGYKPNYFGNAAMATHQPTNPVRLNPFGEFGQIQPSNMFANDPSQNPYSNIGLEGYIPDYLRQRY